MDFIGITLDRSENKIGRMWECPDLFNIDGHDIMIISPQEMKAEGHRFHNAHDTVYLIGQYNKENHKYTLGKIMRDRCRIRFLCTSNIKQQMKEE